MQIASADSFRYIGSLALEVLETTMVSVVEHQGPASFT
jgi:hypothetical protein